MPRKPKKRPPPARLKYEASHPVVSIRVDRDIHDEIRKLKKDHGLSMADIVKVGLQRVDSVIETALKKGYEDAIGDCLGRVDGCQSCYPEVCELIPDDPG